MTACFCQENSEPFIPFHLNRISAHSCQDKSGTLAEQRFSPLRQGPAGFMFLLQGKYQTKGHLCGKYQKVFNGLLSYYSCPVRLLLEDIGINDMINY